MVTKGVEEPGIPGTYVSPSGQIIGHQAITVSQYYFGV